MAQLGYNTAEVPADERSEFSLMPDGDYTLLVNSSEIKAGKKPGAKRLIFTCTVQGPTHKGQKLWPEFNIENPSEVAQRIGRQELNKFAEACGISAASLRDSSQLHNKVFIGEVVVDPGTNGYSDKNEVKRFKPAGVQRPAPARPAAQPARQAPAQDSQQGEPPADHPAFAAPAQGSSVPPWMKQA
jgi:hypothetical protein